VNPKVVASGINIAMAQRLVRKLCQNCKKEVALPETSKKLANDIMSSFDLPEYKDLQREKMWEPVGCDKCNLTGYKGRLGIFEAILARGKLEKVILENPSEQEIVAATKEQNIPNMKQDGIVKVLKGVTSFEELRRVIDLDE
jgi:type IV pilus assembly protein PilB